MLICIYSFNPVLHVAARFFLKIVKMWVRPLVHDAIEFVLRFFNLFLYELEMSNLLQAYISLARPLRGPYVGLRSPFLDIYKIYMSNASLQTYTNVKSFQLVNIN